jgi:hypothetical protein
LPSNLLCSLQQKNRLRNMTCLRKGALKVLQPDKASMRMSRSLDLSLKGFKTTKSNVQNLIPQLGELS